MYSSLASIGCSTSRRTPIEEIEDAPLRSEDRSESVAPPLLVLALRICIIVFTPEQAEARFRVGRGVPYLSAVD